MLVDLGFITRAQADHARTEAQSAGVGVVDLLVANKVIRQADVIQAKAAHFGVEVVHLAEMNIGNDVINAVTKDIARKYRVIPVFKHGNSITIAISDPS